MKDLVVFNGATCADYAVTRAANGVGVAVKRAQAGFKFPDKTVVQTLKASFFGFRKVEIGAHFPKGNGNVPNYGVFNFAEFTHPAREGNTGNSVGQQKVQVFL